MPALLSVLSWIVCLFGFSSAIHADHPAGGPNPDSDHDKKIEIRVQVNGDDVQIEALKDGKKVDLEEIGSGIHALLSHLPGAKVDAEVQAMVVGRDDGTGADANESIKKIIKFMPHLPHHGDQHAGGQHASRDATDTLKSILEHLPLDGKASVHIQKVVRMSSDEDDGSEESGPKHAHANKQVKVFVNRGDEDDHDAQKIMVVKMGKDGDEPKMSWHSAADEQLIVSPEAEVNMVWIGSQQPGKFKLGVGLAPIGNLIRAQLRLADDTGIAVETVMDDSPAAKAGLQRYDIIVKVNDSEVKELSGLIKAIEEAGDSNSAVRLTIVRGGERQTISVMPESNEARAELKREVEWTEKPSNESVDADSLRDLKKQLQELRAAVEQLKKAVNE